MNRIISSDSESIVDIVSHGMPGAFSLDGKVITFSDWEANFEYGRSNNIKQINFWSCKTGRGKEGSDYLTQIANLLLTQVNASSNDVRHASLNASWELDISASPLPPFQTTAIENWRHSLSAAHDAA